MDNWREGKTVLECNRYMLENEVGYDVVFEVGPEDGATETIRAHKYQLAARSPVFFAMFYGEMKAKDEPIRITDIEANVFREILKYIYYESRITWGFKKVSEQLYACEKYMLSGITEDLIKIIDEKNSCDIWQYSLQYGKDKVAAKARQYILDNAGDVLVVDGFLNLPLHLLQEVLSSKDMAATEEEAYKACIAWARHQCEEKDQQFDGPLVREILGDRCIQSIRFPLIDPADFVRLMEAHPNVLTKEEELCILKYPFTNKPGVFSQSHRNLAYLNRYLTVSEQKFWLCSDGNPDAIAFTVDKAIALHGVTVFGTPQQSIISIEVEVFNDQNNSIILQKTPRLPLPGGPCPVRYMFTKETRIPACKEHTVVVKMWGDEVHSGVTGQTSMTEHGVTFNFKWSSRSKNNTNIYGGQIPGFVFRRV